MAEHQLPKLTVRVRFPSSAPRMKAQVRTVLPTWASLSVAARQDRRAIRSLTPSNCQVALIQGPAAWSCASVEQRADDLDLAARVRVTVGVVLLGQSQLYGLILLPCDRAAAKKVPEAYVVSPLDAIVCDDNRPVTTIERPMPPLNVDERTTLESWLDFHRTTLAMKCEGLNDEQASAASVPPSALTLTGIIQHMAEVERNWFRRVLAGEDAPPIYDPQADPDGPDGGFELAENATLGDGLATWHAEIARAREHCATRALSDTGRFADQDVSLRWIYVHMIEEYARHNGHADLIRERIDGIIGV